MNKNSDRALHVITFLIIVLGIIVSALGVFYTTGGKAFDFVNQYGDKVKIYGDGIYANDSYFMAPIFRGTDFTILVFAVPILIAALIFDIKKKNLKNRLFLMSVTALFTYYSFSLAFGATYNVIFLVYIALFSASFFGVILAMGSIDKKQTVENMGDGLPYRGIYVFLVLTGIALFAAWLPDIISSLIKGRSLAMIEVYTTAITYVIDMGIVAPIAYICLYLLKKRNGMGYILLEMLLTICAFVGVMLPMQTIFQSFAGIEIPLPAMITKVASFVVLAFFALYFNFRFFKSMK